MSPALAWRTITEAVEEAAHATRDHDTRNLLTQALVRLRAGGDEVEVVGALLVSLAESAHDPLEDLAEEARAAADAAESAAHDAERAADRLERAIRKRSA